MAKRKAKKMKCKKGWLPFEMQIGKKKSVMVCARFIRPEIKPEKMTWKDWAMLPIYLVGGYHS